MLEYECKSTKNPLKKQVWQISPKARFPHACGFIRTSEVVRYYRKVASKHSHCSIHPSPIFGPESFIDSSVYVVNAHPAFCAQTVTKICAGTRDNACVQ